MVTILDNNVTSEQISKFQNLFQNILTYNDFSLLFMDDLAKSAPQKFKNGFNQDFNREEILDLSSRLLIHESLPENIHNQKIFDEWSKKVNNAYQDEYAACVVQIYVDGSDEIQFSVDLDRETFQLLNDSAEKQSLTFEEVFHKALSYGLNKYKEN